MVVSTPSPDYVHNLSLFLLYTVNKDISFAYISSSSLSIVSVLLVLLSLAIVPRLRAHPAQLFLNRIFMDTTIAVCSIITAASMDIDRHDGRDRDHMHERCKVIGIFYQIGLFGSSCWHFAISLDLLFTIRNPFRSPKGYVKYYYIFIYTAAVTSAIVMLARQDYGFSRYNSCERRDDVDETSLTIWLSRILYGHYRIFSILSLPIVAFSARVLRRTLPPSDSTRQRVLKLNFGCVLMFTTEWVARISISLTGLFLWNDAVDDLKRNNVTDINTDALTAISFSYAILEGIRGVFDSLVWFTTMGISFAEVKWHLRRLRASWNAEDWPKDGMYEALLPQSISSVLRHDMIRCTSWGIIDSAPVGARKITNRSSMVDENGAIQMVTMPRGTMFSRRGDFLSNLAKMERLRRRIHCPDALHCKKFDFCDYSPDVFDRLRSLRGTSAITYCRSFGISSDSDSTALSEKFTEGRSGSFFYFTQDNKYIVKTVTPSEANFLQSNISDYYAYLHRNPNSLLTRFVGLHATRLSSEQKYITLVVMENIFPTDLSVHLCECYDLKGSWVNRQTLKGKDRLKPRSTVTLKDCDLENKFYIGREQKAKLIQQLQHDVQFLLRHGIMDYSLLVGVRKLDSNEQREAHQKPSTNGEDGITKQEKIDHSPPPSLYQPPGLLCPLLQATDNMAAHAASKSCFRSYKGGLLGRPFPRESTLTRLATQPSDTCANVDKEPAQTEVQYDSLSSNRCVYYIGMIDILQQYTISKRLENMYKTNIRCVDREGVSAVDVELYAKRFLRAMDNYFA